MRFLSAVDEIAATWAEMSTRTPPAAPPAGGPVELMTFLDYCRELQTDASELYRRSDLRPEIREALKELRLCLLKTRQLLSDARR
ncbi:MAG TPA: hypothetical protein VGG33_12385 [Polyangia bacterium]